jgi:hypothetical protein
MERKKRAAAMAAVYALIRSSEEHQALSEQTDAAAGSGVPSWPALYNALPNIWGVTGRQSLMQANTMMQLRMFK